MPFPGGIAGSAIPGLLPTDDADASMTITIRSFGFLPTAMVAGARLSQPRGINSAMEPDAFCGSYHKKCVCLAHRQPFLGPL